VCIRPLEMLSNSHSRSVCPALQCQN
jgi:hypothetical protein